MFVVVLMVLVVLQVVDLEQVCTSAGHGGGFSGLFNGSVAIGNTWIVAAGGGGGAQ